MDEPCKNQCKHYLHARLWGPQSLIHKVVVQTKCVCQGIVISVLYSLYTHLYLYVCLRYWMHGLCTCTLRNSETLEPLTWIRVCPSHCYTHSPSLSFLLSLLRTHVLCCHYWTWVNIQHSNQSLDLSFCIST